LAGYYLNKFYTLPKDIYVRNVLLISGEKMETAIIKVSSKGQIVIPSGWRKRMSIEEGEELLAIGEGDTLVLKKIDKSALKDEFDVIVEKIRKKIKAKGLDESIVKEAVGKARNAS